jgi:hypothetical protein
MTPQPPETANRRGVGAAHEFVLGCARVYMTSMAPKTPIAARPAASMPMRAALPSLSLPAALVGEVPALPDLVGPAVPAVVRTVPLFASVA